MRKVVIVLMAALFVCVGSVSEAAEVDHRSWTVVHVSYEVHRGGLVQKGVGFAADIVSLFGLLTHVQKGRTGLFHAIHVLPSL